MVDAPIFEGKTVLVTGGVGSIGSSIVKELLNGGVKKVVVLDNRETAVFYARNENASERCEYFLADITDYKSIEKFFIGIDIVFHAAAMKHVILSEENAYNTININVLGTKNIIDACISHEVEKLIFISTDKAARPITVMGITKLLAEKLISSTAYGFSGKTTFGIVRFGNVLYSNGSVLEIWDNQMHAGKPLTITDERMTRFFMHLPECVKLIFNAAKYATGGETFILKMPSIKIQELLESYKELKGKPDYPVQTIGVRQGEKLHEELVDPSDTGVIMENELFIVRMMSTAKEDAIERMLAHGFVMSQRTNFSSDDERNLLSKGEIIERLKQEIG